MQDEMQEIFIEPFIEPFLIRSVRCKCKHFWWSFLSSLLVLSHLTTAVVVFLSGSAIHEWMFQSEVNYNGFPLLREKGAMDTVYREHVNWNTVQARSTLLMSWLSESGVLTFKRDMQKMRGGTGIENRWCKSCHAQIKYAGGNTTNLRNHISRFHHVLLTLSVPSI